MITQLTKYPTTHVDTMEHVDYLLSFPVSCVIHSVFILMSPTRAFKAEWNYNTLVVVLAVYG
jgi:hypothetical protein